MLLIGVTLLNLSACADPRRSVYEGVLADDATVVTTTTLIAAGNLSPATGRQIYAGAITSRASLNAWYAAVQAGDADGVSSAASAANAGLQVLAQQLTELENERLLRARSKAGRNGLALSQLSRQSTADSKAKVSPAVVIALIQIAADLTPQIVGWINSATAGGTVTDAQVQTAFARLDTDLANLLAAINTAH
jgi:hypothetical protein